MIAGAIALGLLLVFVQSQRASDRPQPASGGVSVEDGASPEPQRGQRPGDEPDEMTATDEGRSQSALGALQPAQVWRAQVTRAVQKVAQERLGHPLPPETATLVLDALANVGPAARSLDSESLDPDDPAAIERVRANTAALVEADRVCRAALGIGAAELIRSLDPSRIDDQAQSADSSPR